MNTPASPQDLLAWSYDPESGARFSPLGSQSALIFHANSVEDAEGRLPRWLRSLGCPSIAISAQEHPLTQAADVWVTSLAEAAELSERIARTPIAAAVAMQLLRQIQHAPLEQGLLAESLAYSTLQAGPEYQRWLASHRNKPQAVPAADTGPAVLMERTGSQLHLRLNRPHNRNAMSVEMRDALMEALRLVLADESITRVTLDGAGNCFSTGGDLKEFGSAPDPATAHLVRGLALPGRLLAACASRVEVKLHGACIGSGLEFPAFAGTLHAAPNTWFQLPELQFGLIPGAGGCLSVMRRIGRQRTAWMILSGEIVDAKRALDWGLVDKLA